MPPRPGALHRPHEEQVRKDEKEKAEDLAPKKIKEEEWFNKVIQSEIAPLIKEYWFDDEDKSMDIIKSLLEK